MSKSILVIDTPRSCNECQFSAERLGGNGRCTLNKDCSNVIPKTGKANWCPLRYLPEKKRNIGFGIETREGGFIDGFNFCIDEILKGENGNE